MLLRWRTTAYLGRHYSVLNVFVFSAVTAKVASLFILAGAIAARPFPVLLSQLDLGLSSSIGLLQDTNR